MQEALAVFNPDQVVVQSAHFIGGQYVAGHGELMDVRRPSDNQLYAGLPLADADLVDMAVQNAWQAFKTSSWATQAPRARRDHAPLGRADRGRCSPPGTHRGDRFDPPDCRRAALGRAVRG